MRTWRQAAEALVADLSQVFDGRLRSVLAYGPHVEGDEEAPITCLALVESLALADLDACARFTSRWDGLKLATPLILPTAEFLRSLDAFPLEYSEIRRAHERLFGDDPFVEVTVAREDLRRACETQIKSHLLHLRESYIEAGGRPTAVAELVSASAPAFTALLRSVAQLNGGTSANRVDATLDGARAAALPDGIVTAMLGLEGRQPIPMTDGARLFPEYLSAVEQLARVVDRWHS